MQCTTCIFGPAQSCIFQKKNRVYDSKLCTYIFTTSLHFCLCQGTFIKDVPFFCHFLRYLPTLVPFCPIFSYIPKIGHPTLANIPTPLPKIIKTCLFFLVLNPKYVITFACVFNVILTGKETRVYHKSGKFFKRSMINFFWPSGNGEIPCQGLLSFQYVHVFSN